MIRRRLSQAGVAAAMVIGSVIAFAAPAFAHAQLLGTSPAGGAVVTTPPGQVVLTFGEAVEAPPTAIEVYGAGGDLLLTGHVGHPAGRSDQVEVTLPPAMKGTYVVSWRVISADTHPVQGAFTFSVGAPSGGTGVGSLEEHLLAARHPSRAVGLLTGTLRTAILLAVLIAVGGAALLVRWPSGLERLVLRRSVLATTAVAALASVGALVTQGPYDAGKPLPDAFHTAVFSPVLHSTFGTGAILRVAASLLMIAGLVAGARGDPRGPGPAGDAPAPDGEGGDGRAGRGRTAGEMGPAGAVGPAWLLATLAGAAGLVVSLSLSGHATTGRWEPFGFMADLLHVGAVSVWLGGLVVLAVLIVAGGRDAYDGELQQAIRRFSATAVVAMALIVASGIFQTWRQVGSWGQLTTTDYGKVLLLKVTLVAAAIEAGWFSRRWVARRLGVAGPDQARRPPGPGAATATGLAGRAGEGGFQRHGHGSGAPRFRRWLAFEAALGIGIVVLTGVLVDAAPPQGERVAAAARAYTDAVSVGSDSLSVAIDPLVPGSVHVAIQLTNRATAPVDAFEVSAQLALPERRIGPLAVPLTHQFTGSWTADNVQVPLAGRWQLRVAVLTDPITETDRTFNFTIYG